jgi:rhamnulokinase
MSTHSYIAIDLGAESGRVMLGILTDGRLTLEEVHRFPTGGITICRSLRWDMLRIWDEIKLGLRKVSQTGRSISSISTDAWGVDYVLMHGSEPMLIQPFHYRDNRTEGGYERVFARVPAQEIFEETGIQFMLINSLYQLEADQFRRPEIMKLAERFLMVGDFIHYLLCGSIKIDESNASTTQLFNPRTKTWSDKLIDRIGIPRRLFPEVVPSGTVLGTVLPEVANEIGLSGTKIVTTCSHDTGAAVAGVPGEGEGWAFLSSGTWSLLGIESAVPIITSESRKFNFTNEVGWGSAIRFLKNIVGLWVVQECRRSWAAEGSEFTYETLTEMAYAAKPLVSLINPSDPRFGKPGEMLEKIADYCRQTGQPVPVTQGEYVRTTLESLALSYRRTIEEIEQVTDKKIKRLHIVGGGTKNMLLNQFAADATMRPVIAGPVEATAIGNVLMQAMALGQLKDHAALRSVVRNSFPVTTHTPTNPDLWEAAYRRFKQLPQEKP